MRRDAKTDSNQAEIVDALRAAGRKVLLLHRVGEGCPDLLVGTKRGALVLLEVKTMRGRLLKEQRAFFEEWVDYPVHVVRTAEEALWLTS